MITAEPRSSPQPVRFGAEFPQLHGAVLTSGSIKLPIRRKADAPNRPVMALVHLHLLLPIKIVNPHPRIPRAARDEFSLLRMQRHARNLRLEFDRLEQLAGGSTGKEVGVFAGGDGEGGGAAERVELTAADGGGEGVRMDGGAGAEVPPADGAIVAGGDEDVEVRAPHDGFDGALVDAGADFVALWGGWRQGGAVLDRGGWGRGCAIVAAAVGGGRGAGEVEDAEFLFHAAGCEDLWARLGREGDGTDDVGVLESVKAFA